MVIFSFVYLLKKHNNIFENIFHGLCYQQSQSEKELTLYLLLSSADNVFKHSGPRSGSTKRRVRS